MKCHVCTIIGGPGELGDEAEVLVKFKYEGVLSPMCAEDAIMFLQGGAVTLEELL